MIRVEWMSYSTCNPARQGAKVRPVRGCLTSTVLSDCRRSFHLSLSSLSVVTRQLCIALHFPLTAVPAGGGCMSSRKQSASGSKRRRSSDDEMQLADSGGDSSGGESDGEQTKQPHHATSESELREAKRLKSLAYSKRLLHDNSAQQSAASLPIPASLLPHSHSDIQKKSEARTNPRFLCLFPGQFRLLPSAHAAIKQQDEAVKRSASTAAVDGAPTSSVAAAGRIGSLEALDSRNPVMYVDFPTGRLRLAGTILYPADTTLLALAHPTKAGKAKKAKPLQCKGTFDHLLVFSEWSWLGRKEDNPTDQPLPMPEELKQSPEGVMLESSAPVDEVEAEGDVEEDEEEEEEEDATRAAAQRELERSTSNGADDDDDEKGSSAVRQKGRDEWDSDAKESDVEDDSVEEEEADEDRDQQSSATRRPQRATRKEVKYDVDMQDSDEGEEAEDETTERRADDAEDGSELQEDEEEEVQEVTPKRSKAKPKTARERANKRRDDEDDEDESASSGGDEHSSDEDYM